jgi:hypothetical protein
MRPEPFMLRPGITRLLLTLATFVALFTPMWLAAQEDPNDVPLGDVARTMRKKTPATKTSATQAVIDDDNLPQVMKKAEQQHPPGSALRYLMDGASGNFRISAPDVTCSLAFTANVKSLLSKQYAEMELPAEDMHKLEGPATIEGGALILAVYNKTDWHVSELTVAFTVVKKPDAHEASLSIEEAPYTASYGAKLSPAVAGRGPDEAAEGGEKAPDVTVIYRMRAAAAPASTTVFSAPLNRRLGADEEWHWAMVQVKGYPPQSYNGPVSSSSMPTSVQNSMAAAAETMAPSSAAAAGIEKAPASTSLPLQPAR